MPFSLGRPGLFNVPGSGKISSDWRRNPLPTAPYFSPGKFFEPPFLALHLVFFLRLDRLQNGDLLPAALSCSPQTSACRGCLCPPSIPWLHDQEAALSERPLAPSVSSGAALKPWAVTPVSRYPRVNPRLLPVVNGTKSMCRWGSLVHEWTENTQVGVTLKALHTRPKPLPQAVPPRCRRSYHLDCPLAG